MAKTVWLTASYHMPATYSIRSPASNQFSAQTLPAPSAATVKLAMIRKSLEIWGMAFTRHTLFPEIMAAKIHVEPPSKVGISTQLLKATKKQTPSLAYREFCHCLGEMVIYAKVNREFRQQFTQLFHAIGYWGRADSFATCMRVKSGRKPDGSKTIRPLSEINQEERAANLEFGVILQVVGDKLDWEDLYDEKKLRQFLGQAIVSFGLEVIEQHSTYRLLLRRSLE